jgi:hypothetical protein
LADKKVTDRGFYSILSNAKLMNVVQFVKVFWKKAQLDAKISSHLTLQLFAVTALNIVLIKKKKPF